MKRFLLICLLMCAVCLWGSAMAQLSDGRVHPITTEEIPLDFQQTIAEGIRSSRISTDEGDYYHLDQFIGEYNQYNRQSKLFRLFDNEVENFVVSADITFNAAHMYSDQLYTGCGFIFRNNDDARTEEPDSFLHTQLVTEGKDFLWGLKEGKFVSYGRKYFANPFASQRTFKVAVFANGADISVLLDGKELRRNKDVAVVTPGLIHYTVQSGNVVDYGMRCTFDNVNLFIPADETTLLAVIREEGNLLDVPGGDSEQIPPGGVPEDGNKQIPPGDAPGEEEDKGGVPSATPTPTLSAFLPIFPWPGGEEDKGGVPSATPTSPAASPPVPGPGGEGDKGGVPSATPEFKIFPTLQTPKPTTVYPPYDENWKPQRRECPDMMKVAFKWGIAIEDFSICSNSPLAQPEDRQKEIDAYCSIMYEFRQACSDGRIPTFFHKYCINFELDLQKRGLYPPYGSEFWKKVPDKVGDFYDPYGQMLNQTYAGCTWDSAYTESICRGYLLNPPKKPSDYQKTIMSLCGVCRDVSTITKYCENPYKNTIPANCSDITRRCWNNIDYMVCKNIDQLKQSKGANLKEIEKIKEYCWRYGINPVEPAPPKAEPMMLPGGGDDGTKGRPETSPVKPPEEEEEKPEPKPTCVPWIGGPGCP